MAQLPDLCDEVHGLNDARKSTMGGYSGHQRVTVTADGLWVRLGQSDATCSAGLTPPQARYLADKLYHCAELVEQRQRKESPS